MSSDTPMVNALSALCRECAAGAKRNRKKSISVGFIAIVENGELVGYNLLAGGGMGSTFGMETTYPRLANVIGFVKKEDIVEAAKAVLIFQRDHGNRSERKFSRLKYTIDRLGLAYFNEQIKDALGDKLSEARPFKFDSNGDKLGWSKGYNGKWYFTLFIQGGKVRDDKHLQLKTALREIASVLKGNFTLTGNQNLVIGDIEEKDKAEQTVAEVQAKDEKRPLDGDPERLHEAVGHDDPL